MDKELGGKDNMFLLSSSRYSDIQIFNIYISNIPPDLHMRFESSLLKFKIRRKFLSESV
jgi:hypothetical protein